jgi:predicted glycosyltransferase
MLLTVTPSPLHQRTMSECGRHYVFYSHDGFGVGHARRNWVIARAVLNAEPSSRATIITGVPHTPGWLGGARMSVVRVPPLIKSRAGGYQATGVSFEEAVRVRSEAFLNVIRSCCAEVVVVDRHPYGTAGELRPGLEEARAGGAALVLGLRDVLDQPDVVAAELAGPGWADVPELFDRVLIYGSAAFCDHQREYGLPVNPIYCGWVVEPVERRPVDPRLLVVAAGGGGDGGDTFRLGLAALERLEGWHGVLVAGPYANQWSLRLTERSRARGRLAVRTNVAGCGQIFSGAGAVVQMAGYNSTFEALVAGCRPVLVPRSYPRQEQLIRAERLAALDLADVLGEDADPSELVGLLAGPRHLASGALERAGIGCDGARRAASVLEHLADRTMTRSAVLKETGQ